MTFLDWLIVLVPLAGIMGVGYYSRRYVHGVADFLAAGRVCGRYTICVVDVANGLSLIGLVAYIEIAYKTGFAMAFWSYMTMPLLMVISLTGFCVYRFRATRAMSLGQFLEMRYNRPFRVFAAALRSTAEMLANMIMPAIAARFFIYFLDLPVRCNVFGFQVSTYMVMLFVTLSLAVGLICMGGTLTIIIADTVQGLLCYPLLVVFTIFVLLNFSWTKEIVPVMLDRVPGESFINPYDVYALRDFNLFAFVVGIFAVVMHCASWIGGGTTSAAKSPHEQKMASVLGAWRTGFSMIFYMLVAIMILVLLNHANFSPRAKSIRDNISAKVAAEVVSDGQLRAKVIERTAALPPQHHEIGVDAPLSEKKNLDTPYLSTVLDTLRENESAATANVKFQEFRTLYHQLMLPFVMRDVLPPVMMGLFCLFVVLMMVSTDNNRIYSAALTITQDVILPFKKNGFTPKGHIRLLRLVSVGVGLFFICGSSFMAQLDYINLFIQICCSLWLGGCGPVMLFGLYSRFGTTAGAFASLGSGMGLTLGGILIQRNWASHVYPWLDGTGWVEPFGNFLTFVSQPFNPYVIWEMNPIKCPVNSIEMYFIIMLLTLCIYCIVSRCTCKEPFNLDRMLHRGKYSPGGIPEAATSWSLRSVLKKLIGITPEYSRGDRVIAWSVFLYSFGYQFILVFLAVVIWNLFSPWSTEAWMRYFLWVFLIIPGSIAAFSTVWFTIGGSIDLFRLFRDLEHRESNVLDDGRVDCHVSLADKKELEKIDKTQ